MGERQEPAAEDGDEEDEDQPLLSGEQQQQKQRSGSGSGGGSSSSVSSMWRAPASSNRDDFTVVDEDTGVDDGFGDFSRASFEVDDFQSELDAAVRTQPA
jgi:hypothetical protein